MSSSPWLPTGASRRLWSRFSIVASLVEEAERLNALNLEFFRLAVDDVKADRLELAEQTGSQFISLFSVSGRYRSSLDCSYLPCVRPPRGGAVIGDRHVEGRGMRQGHVVHIFTFEGVRLYGCRRPARNAGGSDCQHHPCGVPPERGLGETVHDPQQLHDPLRGYRLLRGNHSDACYRVRIGVVGEPPEHHRGDSRTARGDGEASRLGHTHPPAGVAHHDTGGAHNVAGLVIDEMVATLGWD